MSEATLDEIISENYFSSEFIRELKYYYLNQKTRVEDILKHSEMENEVAVQEETNIQFCFIPLAGIFGGQDYAFQNKKSNDPLCDPGTKTL